jgi:mRNA interferase YafQ
MYKVIASNKFQKDYKLCKKRGLNMSLINDLILELEKSGKVPSKHKPHLLKGNYKGLWECHIQPDWLLVLMIEEDVKLISLTRTGTHSDLF